MLAQRLCFHDGQDFSEAWNFGPDDADGATVGEVAQRIGSLWGDGSVTLLEQPNLPHEARATPSGQHQGDYPPGLAASLVPRPGT